MLAKHRLENNRSKPEKTRTDWRLLFITDCSARDEDITKNTTRAFLSSFRIWRQHERWMDSRFLVLFLSPPLRRSAQGFPSTFTNCLLFIPASFECFHSTVTATYLDHITSEGFLMRSLLFSHGFPPQGTCHHLDATSSLMGCQLVLGLYGNLRSRRSGKEKKSFLKDLYTGWKVRVGGFYLIIIQETVYEKGK